MDSWVVLKEYGDSALKFSVRIWTTFENYWDALYDLYDNIFNALKAKGISIPFNRLDVQVLPGENDAPVKKAVSVVKPRQTKRSGK